MFSNILFYFILCQNIMVKNFKFSSHMFIVWFQIALAMVKINIYENDKIVLFSDHMRGRQMYFNQNVVA